MSQTKTEVATRKKSPLAVNIYNIEGQEIDKIMLPQEIFDVQVSERLLAQYVRVYLANQRQGTQSVKTRGEVVGSTRKIYRQKGTGRARHGSRKAPIFVGGGAAHAPKPRDFRLQMNKKQKRKALLGALSHKAYTGDICVIEGLSAIAPKTKSMNTLLQKLSLADEKKILLLYVYDKTDNLLKAVRNLACLTAKSIKSLNPYLILKNKKLILTKEALEQLKTQLLST